MDNDTYKGSAGERHGYPRGNPLGYALNTMVDADLLNHARSLMKMLDCRRNIPESDRSTVASRLPKTA